MRLLLDSDMLLMRATSSCQVEVETQPDIWTRFADVSQARDWYWEQVDEFCSYFETTRENVVHCFTQGSAFRKAISPEYKANRRSKPKPIGYKGLRDEFLNSDLEVFMHDEIEADDALGLLATKLKTIHEPYAILSGDKDLRQVAGRRKWIDQEEEYVSVQEAERTFWVQVLAGDSTDNVPGCPGYGKISAEKATKDWDMTKPKENWAKVVALYAKKGKDSEFALQQARLVRILRDEEYDFNTRQVNLWNP